MRKKPSYLFDKFVIDGVEKPVSPERILRSAFPSITIEPSEGETVVDETLDLAPSVYVFDENKVAEYINAVRNYPKGEFPMLFPESASNLTVASTLIETVWRTGHHKLEDLALEAAWTWNSREIGNMASFYESVGSVAAYLENMDVPLLSASVSEGRPALSLRVSGCAYRRKCPAAALPKPDSWLVYIPFDSCEFRLGGSLLSRAENARSAVGPDITDADYFIDCYEVVRELVEDGVVKAGIGVGLGGLALSLERFGAATGVDVNVSGVCKAYGEFPVRVLFAEVPGVLVQIEDADFDYLDAELLLQDIAYFPLGHPVSGSVNISSDAASGLSSILDSLLGSMATEGED